MNTTAYRFAGHTGRQLGLRDVMFKLLQLTKAQLRRQPRSEQDIALEQIRNLRRTAYRQMSSNPRLATDLLAAADRHEQQLGAPR